MSIQRSIKHRRHSVSLHFTPDTPPWTVVMEWNDETRATADGTVALPPLRGNRGPKQRLAAAGPGPYACTAQAAVAVRVVTNRRRGPGGKGGTLTTRQASLSQPVAYKTTNHTLRRPGRPRPAPPPASVGEPADAMRRRRRPHARCSALLRGRRAVPYARSPNALPPVIPLKTTARKGSNFGDP